MRLKRYLIAGGNSTLIVWDCLPGQRENIIKKYLGEVEQIGFVTMDTDSNPRFTMMGNEFSGNGTLAFASTLGKSGNCWTSGIHEPVEYLNRNQYASISVPIKYKRDGDVVLLEGIGYLCADKDMEVTKEFLVSLADKYGYPAFGVAVCTEGRLIPYVYVKSTNSLFKETACGSGSIAASIATGLEEITQPSGKIISVKQKGNRFLLTAMVTTVDNSTVI